MLIFLLDSVTLLNDTLTKIIENHRGTHFSFIDDDFIVAICATRWPILVAQLQTHTTAIQFDMALYVILIAHKHHGEG